MFELTPFSRTMMNPFYEMDRLARSFFADTPVRTFSTDVQDNGQSYILEAELPGFRKEDIAIDIDGDRLTIQAQRNSENDQKDSDGSYLRRERYYGSYSRSFDISRIDGEKISASYENGVLKLEMPKKNVTVPAARRLEIQ